MGIVVEYANRQGQPQWTAPPQFRWSYAQFAQPGVATAAPDETIDMLVEKQNAAEALTGVPRAQRVLRRRDIPARIDMSPGLRELVTGESRDSDKHGNCANFGGSEAGAL
jgi:hypothetical protein